jgi:hypothetical protein
MLAELAHRPEDLGLDCSADAQEHRDRPKAQDYDPNYALRLGHPVVDEQSHGAGNGKAGCNDATVGWNVLARHG